MDTDALVAKLRGIYAIVNEGARDPVQLTADILSGGVRIVQYRAKSGIVAAHARAMRTLTRERGAVFIINDDWRAVERFEADGVHTGPEDARPAQLPQIRRALQGRILGLSCGTPEEARAAAEFGADYVGIGCVFPTTSKADAGEPIGIEGLKHVARAADLPAAAIGGITIDNVRLVRDAGAAMAAVISAIASSEDARAAAHQLVTAWTC
ncbi:MAG TPA: thiamine phosphate synthase [Candidatus Baltobacteraceae bacterium]|jgi:thiamine-phosphate pyrophosphorylase|nr:thiamine phosphate synthase [Candidatus Baltobacteraceae bacterium]